MPPRLWGTISDTTATNTTLTINDTNGRQILRRIVSIDVESSNQQEQQKEEKEEKLKIKCEHGNNDWIEFTKKGNVVYIDSHERGKTIRGYFKMSQIAKLIKQMNKIRYMDTEEEITIKGIATTMCRTSHLNSDGTCDLDNNVCRNRGNDLEFQVEKRWGYGFTLQLQISSWVSVFIMKSERQNELFFDFFKTLSMKGGNKKMKDLITTNCIEEENDSLTLVDCNDGKEFAFRATVDDETSLIFMEKDKAVEFAKLILKNAGLDD